MSDLKENSVSFTDLESPPAVLKAQINSRNCAERKQLLPKNKYKNIQDFISSGEPALSVIQKEKSPSSSRCLVDVVGVDEFFSKTWLREPDGCEKKGYVKVRSAGLKSVVYFSKEQFGSLLKLAQVKAQAKKAK